MGNLLVLISKSMFFFITIMNATLKFGSLFLCFHFWYTEDGIKKLLQQYTVKTMLRIKLIIHSQLLSEEACLN